MQMKGPIVAVALCAAALATTALEASAGVLKVPQIRTNDKRTTDYQCAGGKSLTVTYWNTDNGQSFALLPVSGKMLLFVDTLSGSGAKYQTGRYTWWTKGHTGDLYDEMAGPNAPPILSDCSTAR